MTNISNQSIVARLRDHENEGVTASDRFALREEAAAALAAAEAERDRALAESAERASFALALQQRAESAESDWQAAEQRAAQAEKDAIERCAKVCEDVADKAHMKLLTLRPASKAACTMADIETGAESCAAAIRALAAAPTEKPNE